MAEEIAELDKKTWKLVPLPSGVGPIKTKWVYLTKMDHEKDVILRRARLLAKGFTQRQGIDYEEVFAPVTKYSTVRFSLL